MKWFRLICTPACVGIGWVLGDLIFGRVSDGKVILAAILGALVACFNYETQTKVEHK